MMNQFAIIDRNQFPSAEKVGEIIANTAKQERAAHALKGYWFDFGAEEAAEFSRTCGAFRIACYDMARYARAEFRNIEFFKNMNGQLGIRLVPKW